MGEEINIIQSGWKHHALLAELGAATFFETFIDYHDENDLRQYINKIYNIEQLKKNVSDNRIHYFTAYDNEGDVGYIKLIDDVKPGGLEGKIIELEKIYVRKRGLGKHIGAALMQKAIDFSRQQGFEHLFLGVWQENVRAIKFYEKFGFKNFGTRKFVLGSQECDDFLMVLDL